jgi:hypothetical protein
MNEINRIVNVKRKRESTGTSDVPNKVIVIETDETDGSLSELKLLKSLGISNFNPYQHQSSVWLAKYLAKLKVNSVFDGNEFFYLSNFLDSQSRQW